VVAAKLLKDDSGTRVNDIDTNNQGKKEDCLIEVIREYMRSGDISWQVVIDSIRSAGDSNLATKLQKSCK